MRRNRPLPLRALVGVLLCVVAVAATRPRPAEASDLDELRAQAQRVADDITALEHRLEDLRTERARLDGEIESLTQEIGLLERTIDESAGRVESARARYVEHAIEAYKNGGTSRLGLLLSADDMSELLDLAEAMSRAATADVDALQDLRGALRKQERAQDRVDTRKQKLLAAQADNVEVTARMEAIVESRSSALAELNARIEQLEAEARLRAARQAREAATDYGDPSFARLLNGTGPVDEIPKGYVGTGVVFEGIASWYGPGFEGEATANGQIFDPGKFTAASRDLPFGTTLFVRHEGRGVIVVINDRGPYLQERILDLSRAAAEAIGLGLGWVQAEIVLPTEAR